MRRQPPNLLPCLALLLFVCFISAAQASNEYGNRPRGVPPELSSFYEAKSEFQCLSGNKKIPFDQVNDDYCDCDDGSDEPGTAACASGSFYCRNSGFRPLTIPSNRVNDYICDCCDGSDEWDSGIECPNLCSAQGEKAREEEKAIRSMHAAGYTKRVELAKSGSKSLEEKRTELEKHRKELEEIETMRAALEGKKNQAEESEREAKKKQDDAWNALKEERRKESAKALFAQLDANSDALLSMAEVIEQGPEGRDNSSIKELFDNSADNQLGFDKFIESFEQIRDFVRKPPPEKEKKEDSGGEKKSVEEVKFPDEEHIPDHSVEEEEKDDEDEDEEDTPANGGDKDRPPYDEATQHLIHEADEARKEYRELQDKIHGIENTIRNSESFLEFEYGNDHAWAPLKTECAELTTHQYTYRLCLFDKASQKDRNGHSETNLGHWGKWNGPDSDKFSAQLYDKGQSCWNGPERSTKVEIQCGEQLQLVEASEPSKCEYKFVLKAPAACRNPEEVEREHQEL